MKKKYLDFVIEKMVTGTWWAISKNGEHLAMAIDESEARRRIWIELGRDPFRPIIDKMMEVV